MRKCSNTIPRGGRKTPSSIVGGCEKLIVVKGLVTLATPSLEARYRVSVFEGVIGAKYSNHRCDQMVAKWIVGTSSNPNRLFHRGPRVCA
jgi:hypothetical protein